MTTLALAVDATDELWTLDDLPTPEAPYVEVEDELIEIRSRFPSSYYTLTGETLPPRIRVRRGIAGTTTASHVQGSTLTPNYGLGSSGGGGGAIAVDNTVDPPAEVTTLIVPGVVISGDEAAMPGRFYAQATDPGVVGAGAIWKDISGGTALSVVWRARNDTDDGWTPLVILRVVASEWDDAVSKTLADSADGNADASPTALTSGEGNAYAVATAVATGSGGADAGPDALTDGAGLADAGPRARADGAGSAYATLTAVANGAGDASVAAQANTSTGTASAGSLAIRSGIVAGMSAEVDGTSARMAFNDTAPIAKPVVPLTTPGAQDVIDALVALGLITQSD